MPIPIEDRIVGDQREEPSESQRPVDLYAVGGVAADVGGGDAGEPDGGAVSFATVQPIFASSCVTCHDPAHPFALEVVTYPAMDLTANDAYAALVSKGATETCGGVLVTPGDPSRSYLYAKITEDPPCDGTRMPHPGMAFGQPVLPADQIATIESWIRGGARP